jgi:tetratricopeptide (TPR) repeat protein
MVQRLLFLALRDTGAAVRRFEAVVRLDDRNILGDYALSGYEALRKQYLHDGDLAGELRATRAMVDILGYPAHYELLEEASRQLSATDSAAAAALQSWMLGRLERKAGALRARGATRDYSIAMADIARVAARIRYDAYYGSGPDAFRGETARISAATGDSIPLVMERGIAAYYAGDFAGASQALEPAIRRGLRFEKLYGLLVYALYAQGRPEDARRCYDEGMREHPRSFNIPISYGYAFLLREDVDRAEPLLAFALRQGPPPARAAELQAMLRRIAEYRDSMKR